MNLLKIIKNLWKLPFGYLIGFYASVLNNLEISGAEVLKNQKGVLLASNHISSYDTVFLPWAIIKYFPFRLIWAPAKKELFSIPLFGWLISSWGAFPVIRGRDTKASGKINKLLETEFVMLFPEGTRHKDGVLGEGNRGVGKIIFETRACVIPVALVNLHRWKFPSLFSKGKIVFGQPVDFSDLIQDKPDKETYKLITARVMAEIKKLLDANS